MKILAFAGTNSDNSINRKLVEYTLTHFSGHEVDYIDLNDYEMPIYKIQREQEGGIPQPAKAFADKIDRADLIIMALAEHNSTYTAAFKNLWDWTSRIAGRKHFGDKPVFLLSTATGPGGGKNVSEAFMKRAPFSGAQVITNFVLPKFRETFEEGKGIVDGEKSAEFEEKVQQVISYFA